MIDFRQQVYEGRRSKSSLFPRPRPAVFADRWRCQIGAWVDPQKNIRCEQCQFWISQQTNLTCATLLVERKEKLWFLYYHSLQTLIISNCYWLSGYYDPAKSWIDDWILTLWPTVGVASSSVCLFSKRNFAIIQHKRTMIKEWREREWIDIDSWRLRASGEVVEVAEFHDVNSAGGIRDETRSSGFSSLTRGPFESSAGSAS